MAFGNFKETDNSDSINETKENTDNTAKPRNQILQMREDYSKDFDSKLDKWETENKINQEEKESINKSSKDAGKEETSLLEKVSDFMENYSDNIIKGVSIATEICELITGAAEAEKMPNTITVDDLFSDVSIVMSADEQMGLSADEVLDQMGFCNEEENGNKEDKQKDVKGDLESVVIDIGQAISEIGKIENNEDIALKSPLDQKEQLQKDMEASILEKNLPQTGNDHN